MAALALIEVDVLIPFGSGQPYDLGAVLPNGRFLRVQVKTGWLSRGCILFNAYGTDHGNGPRSYRGLAEIFAVFFPPDRSVYLLPVGTMGPGEGRLRLSPTKNNQRRGIRLAADYEMSRWTAERLAAVLEIPQRAGA